MSETKSEKKQIWKNEARSKRFEETATLLAQSLEDAHFVRMEREIQSLKASYNNFSREQRREKLLKIEEHLKETLKERPVPTASDYDAMISYHIFTTIDLFYVDFDFQDQQSLIMELDPSISFEYVKADVSGVEKGDDKNCWKRLKEASVEVLKKVVKRKN